MIQLKIYLLSHTNPVIIHPTYQKAYSFNRNLKYQETIGLCLEPRDDHFQSSKGGYSTGMFSKMYSNGIHASLVVMVLFIGQKLP